MGISSDLWNHWHSAFDTATTTGCGPTAGWGCRGGRDKQSQVRPFTLVSHTGDTVQTPRPLWQKQGIDLPVAFAAPGRLCRRMEGWRRWRPLGHVHAQCPLDGISEMSLFFSFFFLNGLIGAVNVSLYPRESLAMRANIYIFIFFLSKHKEVSRRRKNRKYNSAARTTLTIIFRPRGFNEVPVPMCE